MTTSGAWLPKELTKTMVQLLSNPHNSGRSIVSNTTNRDQAPAVVQLSKQQAMHGFQ